MSPSGYGSDNRRRTPVTRIRGFEKPAFPSCQR
jgi:hypothetical protein